MKSENDRDIRISILVACIPKAHVASIVFELTPEKPSKSASETIYALQDHW